MHFSNILIDVTQIPHVEDVKLKPIAAMYRKVMLIRWAILWLVLLAILISLMTIFKLFYMPVYAALLIVIFVLIAAFDFINRKLSFKNMSYAVRQHDVLFKKGWLIQTFGVCPVKKIQHCKVSSDVFERKYQLATLLLYTAGSDGADMKIRGLLKEEAEKLRAFLMEGFANGRV